MKSDKLLVFTSRGDEHADYVIEKINDTGRGDWVVRINTEDFAVNCVLEFSVGGFSLVVEDSNRVVTSNEVAAVWFRRPEPIDTSHFDNSAEAEFVAKQANAALRGFYFCLHDSSRWINPLPALHRSRIKLQQLQLAHALGFSVPDTLVTNQPDAAIAFAERHRRVCTKSLDEPSFKTGNNFTPVFTRILKGPDELQDARGSIRSCPVLLQEYIEKQADVRVIVFGERVFAFEIHSQEHPLSAIDFRGVSPEHLRHELVTLPPEVEKRVATFVRQQGLLYSAMDLVKSRDNRWVFLENNPNGQWLWLELITKVPLHESLLELFWPQLALGSKAVS